MGREVERVGFKKLRGVVLPEEKQGLVRYICLNSDSQPKRTQDKIQRLCDDVGGAYSAALREVMCGRKSITAISREFFVSESKLYDMRKVFYEKWFK